MDNAAKKQGVHFAATERVRTISVDPSLRAVQLSPCTLVLHDCGELGKRGGQVCLFPPLLNSF